MEGGLCGGALLHFLLPLTNSPKAIPPRPIYLFISYSSSLLIYSIQQTHAHTQRHSMQPSMLSVFLFLLVLALGCASAKRPLVEEEEFDFIVVGTGTAGAAVAARLTEVGHWTVLALDKGICYHPVAAVWLLY